MADSIYLGTSIIFLVDLRKEATMLFYQSVSDDLNVFKEHRKGLNLPHKIPVEARLHLFTLACF